MEIVQDSVGFIDGHTSMEDGVDPRLIQDVINEEVSRVLMENAPMIILREMRPKLLCLKVDEKVVVPGVILGDEGELFIGKIHIDG
jgi:hypothetical protein